MVRNQTKTPDRRLEQWLDVWLLLPAPWRAAIQLFCMKADRDVATAIAEYGEL